MYREEIDKSVMWCEDNHLILNVSKTKELVIDFRKKTDKVSPITINGNPIEIISSYKYLGVHIDQCLNWKINSVSI